MMLETAWRRPQQFRLAVSLALMHKHFYEYVCDVCAHLDRVIDELESIADRPIADWRLRAAD
jgi:hypothetical protein